MDFELNSSTLAFGTAIVGALVIIYWGFLRKSGQRKSRLPPGPRPWPVIGNLLNLSAPLHEGLSKMSQKYGDLLFLRLGSINAIVVSSPKRVEEVLKTHDQIFAARPQTSFTEIVLGNGQTVGAASYGPYWRHARKVLNLELLTPKRIQGFQGLRRACALRMLESVFKECDGGKTTRMNAQFNELLIQNVTKMTLGETFHGQDSVVAQTVKGNHDFIELMHRTETLAQSFVVGDFFPALRRFDLFGYKKRMKQVAKESHDIMESILSEHEERRLKSSEAYVDRDGQDFVDVLLNRSEAQDEKPLTRFQMRALLHEIFMAGMTSSSTTLTWALSELVKNPSVLKKAQDEIDSVVGRDRLVTEADLPRLPYIRAVVNESHRLHAIVPLLVPHATSEACVLQDGYEIPKDCMTFINVWAIGRDPALWENPLEFDPERFSGENLDSGARELKYLPFGYGRRQCPGKALADILVEYSLAVALHAYNWTLPQGMAPGDMDMSDETGISIQKKTPLEVVASPRLPASVIFSNQ